MTVAALVPLTSRPEHCSLESWADRVIDTAKRTDIEAADKRVICDGYKWLLSKLRPERYGERLLVGSDPDHPIQHLHQVVSLRDLSTETLDALEAFCDRVIVEHEGAAATRQHAAVERPCRRCWIRGSSEGTRW